jgi:uncharacterized protein YlxP (DUF503 family)
MVVGVAQFEIFMPFNHSLKEKRKILRKLKERVFSKFSIPVAEVDFQDKWQRASLGFSIVGNDGKKIESLISKIFNFIEELQLGEMSNEAREILIYENR